ncbi:hypothetical protein BSY17_1695 [Sphingobium sp. RAC03]|nr:hypothetical protein BSY17_1695 [Sphingobium sp. RAC03]
MTKSDHFLPLPDFSESPETGLLTLRNHRFKHGRRHKFYMNGSLIPYAIPYHIPGSLERNEHVAIRCF